MKRQIQDIDNYLSNTILDDCINRGTKDLFKHWQQLQANQFNQISSQILERKSTLTKVGLITGFPVKNQLETDGPFGIAVLIKLLKRLGFSVEVWTSSLLLASLKRFLENLNLFPTRIRSQPSGKILAQNDVKIFLKSSPIDILVSVETPGQNCQGVYHNMHGNDISQNCADFDSIFQYAQEKNILTIGIGDGGNELGLGQFNSTIREHIPYGEVCICPCKQGIASATKSTYAILAGISNWGAYSLAAVLAYQSKTPFLHSPREEKRFLHLAKKIGLVDGTLENPNLSVDSVAPSVLYRKVKAIIAFPNRVKGIRD